VYLCNFGRNNHFSNSLSIYSPDDIWSISHIFNSNLMVNVNTFTLPLVTESGTQYVMMVENLTMFRKFAEKFTEGNLDSYYDLYENFYKIKKTNTNEGNEREFLKYLNRIFGGSGLKLFRGNSTFTEWMPLKLDQNNTVLTESCL